MGAIKVIRSVDGKPYISLEDLIKELEGLRISLSMHEDSPPEFLVSMIHTLNAMEQEYYTKVLTHTGNINPKRNAETEPDPAETEMVIDDLETALVMELFQNLKIPKRKLNMEQSKIAAEIDEIAGATLIIREWVTPEELNNYKTKMIGIRTICSHSNLKYEYWTMMVEAVQKKAMTKDELLKMIQQEILKGKVKIKNKQT
jgi:hypothetical protein